MQDFLAKQMCLEQRTIENLLSPNVLVNVLFVQTLLNAASSILQNYSLLYKCAIIPQIEEGGKGSGTILNTLHLKNKCELIRCSLTT